MHQSNTMPKASFFSVYSADGKHLIGFACNSGPKGWLPCNADGEGISGPLPTVDACASLLRELALHGAAADGD
jgi:hypothetical protein